MRYLVLAALFLAFGALAGAAREPILVKGPGAPTTLVNPACSHCKDEAARRRGELKADDRVLCWTRGKYDGGAIPYRFFLNAYPVISDTYGVFVHDPDAGFARGFAPSLDFAFHGWRNGVMAMRHKDGTLYSCLTGVAFAGPKKGARLVPVPTQVGAWGDWLARYPDTVAYRMFDKYKAVEAPPRGSPHSRKSRGPLDRRLPEKEEVLGVVAGKQARAYRLADLAKAGVVRDTLDGAPCVVLYYGLTRTASAYRPEAEEAGKRGIKVTLVPDGRVASAPFRDKETGSRWDVAGRCVAGDLKGRVLPWVDSTQVRWFAWAAEHPHVTIHPR